MKKKVICYQL